MEVPGIEPATSSAVRHADPYINEEVNNNNNNNNNNNKKKNKKKQKKSGHEALILKERLRHGINVFIAHDQW